MAIAAIITGDISPLMMRRISVSISSWKISRCSMMRVSASVLEMGMKSSYRVALSTDTARSTSAADTSRCVTRRRGYAVK